MTDAVVDPLVADLQARCQALVGGVAASIVQPVLPENSRAGDETVLQALNGVLAGLKEALSAQAQEHEANTLALAVESNTLVGFGVCVCLEPPSPLAHTVVCLDGSGRRGARPW